MYLIFSSISQIILNGANKKLNILKKSTLFNLGGGYMNF